MARRDEHSQATTTLKCDGVHSSSTANVELVPVSGTGTQRPRRRRSTLTAYRRSRHSYSPIIQVGVEHRPVWTYAGNTPRPVRRQNFSRPHCHAGRLPDDDDDVASSALPTNRRSRRRSPSTRIASNSADVKFAAAAASADFRRRRRARSSRLRRRPPCRALCRRRSTLSIVSGRSGTRSSTALCMPSDSSSAVVGGDWCLDRYCSRSHSVLVVGGRQRKRYRLTADVSSRGGRAPLSSCRTTLTPLLRRLPLSLEQMTLR